MKDLDILNQLLHCNHLEPKELERARELIYRLNLELQMRVK